MFESYPVSNLWSRIRPFWAITVRYAEVPGIMHLWLAHSMDWTCLQQEKNSPFALVLFSSRMVDLEFQFMAILCLNERSGIRGLVSTAQEGVHANTILSSSESVRM